MQSGKRERGTREISDEIMKREVSEKNISGGGREA